EIRRAHAGRERVGRRSGAVSSRAGSPPRCRGSAPGVELLDLDVPVVRGGSDVDLDRAEPGHADALMAEAVVDPEGVADLVRGADLDPIIGEAPAVIEGRGAAAEAPRVDLDLLTGPARGGLDLGAD